VLFVPIDSLIALDQGLGSLQSLSKTKNDEGRAMQLLKVRPRIILVSLSLVILLGQCSKSDGQVKEPRGEIRIVESWRPDINALAITYSNTSMSTLFTPTN
jgi:hypothetical protein